MVVVVVVVEVVTDTRHYHNCESEQPAITSGESGATLSTEHHQVPLSQHQISDITINASPSYNDVIAKYILQEGVTTIKYIQIYVPPSLEHPF